MTEQLLLDRLKNNNLSNTAERMKLFNLLSAQSQPCTINEIVALASPAMNRSTVYRNIEIFEEVGIVTSINTGRDNKYELSDQFSSHHHHMTCTNCGSVIPFNESETFKAELDRIQNSFGFKADSHSLELKGLCSVCCKL